MKVENMLKIKEEFDYKSLARKLDVQVESLIAQHERQQKAYQDEIEKISLEAKKQISQAEKKFADSLEVINYMNYSIIRCFLILLCFVYVEGKIEISKRLYGVNKEA